VGLNVTDQPLLRFLAFVHMLGKKKWEYNETVHKLFTDFKKAYDSIRREVLYSIIWGTHETCLNKTHSEVHQIIFLSRIV
jgi:hypothetical protein